MEEDNEIIMETEIESIKKSFYINQGEKIYKLVMILDSDGISLNVSEMNRFMQSYEIKLNLEKIKEKHISFSKLNSLQEFLNIIQENLDKKTIIIYKKSDNIIRFEFKKDSVFFELTKEQINIKDLVENIDIIMQKYDTKISNLENNFGKISKENKNLKKEIDELKKNNEILNEENKKFQEEKKKIKRFENLSEDINKQIQVLIQLVLEKEEMKKPEDFKLEQKIQLLNQDIQNLKDDIKKLIIQKDENLFSHGININKNKKENSRNCSSDNKNKNNLFFDDKENSKKNNKKKLRRYSEENKDKSYDHFIEIEEKENFMTPKHKINKRDKIENCNYIDDVKPINLNFNKSNIKLFHVPLDNNLYYDSNQNKLIISKKSICINGKNEKDNKKENNYKIYKKHIPQKQKINLRNKNKNTRYQHEQNDELINSNRAKSTNNRDFKVEIKDLNNFIFKSIYYKNKEELKGNNNFYIP